MWFNLTGIWRKKGFNTALYFAIATEIAIIFLIGVRQPQETPWIFGDVKEAGIISLETPMQTEVKTWYTVMLSVKGDTFTVKMKKKDEKVSFSKLKVILEGKDPNFKSGYFGTYGSEVTDVAYYDNVIIAESEDEVEKAALSVRPLSKLPISWGKIKFLFR